MPPEHEARARVLYDHESEETGRRRHAVADWGVGEDIFDRMPSRRFARADRRAAHSGTVVISREPEAVRVDVEPGAEPWAEPRREPARAQAEPAEPAPRFARAEAAPEREVDQWREDQPRRERAVESWLDAEPAPHRFERAQPEAAPAEPSVRLVAATARPEPARVPSAPDELAARRTVVISGHPGGLPAARPARPPKTAIERVGTRPDRIVAYAVALGFLLVLIAVLTTGQ
jgi:nicotinate-nucleotide--dimethylbenzimidazole phosphoribosyltransferase